MSRAAELSASNLTAGQSVVIDAIRWRLDVYTVIRVFGEGSKERIELRRKRDGKIKITAPGELRLVDEWVTKELQNKANAEARARQFRKRFTFMSK